MTSKLSSYDEKGMDGTFSSSVPSWANVSFGEVTLGERIGGGGVGIIYKGYWKKQPVALKTLFDARISNDLKQEYMDELLVMSRVSHSNIVKFLGACMTPPNLCFIMELCQTSLFTMLHVDRVRFSIEEIYAAAIDVACAMEYLHSLSPAIIHRDLKSHNILKSYEGNYKLCDFGLVKNRNTTAGTPAYMAPAGKRPTVPAYGISSRVMRLINKCWDQSPDRRPEFPDVVDELYEIEKEQPECKHTENVKDSVGDILDGLISSGSRK
eukprot:gene36760-44592_t